MKGEQDMKVLTIKNYFNHMMCCCMQMYVHMAYFCVYNVPLMNTSIE